MRNLEKSNGLIIDFENLSSDDLREYEKIAEGIIPEFNHWIDKLSLDHLNNIDWWVSEGPSRNPFTSEFFTTTISAVFIKKLIQSGRRIHSIFTANHHLKKVLDEYILNENIYKINIVLKREKFFLIKKYLYYLKEFFKNIYQIIKFWIATKKVNILDESTPSQLILVDTFVLENSFQNGQFNDRYFRGFGGFLTEKQKEKMYYCPVFYDTNNHNGLFKNIKNCESKFLIKEYFLKFSDYIFAFTFPLRILFLKVKNYDFYGFSMSKILKKIMIEKSFSYNVIEGLLKYRFAYRLKEKNFSISRVIEWFENQIVDKGACFGYRKFFPDTLIVGYSVPYVSKYYFTMSPTRSERIAGVVPHITAVSGKKLIPTITQFDPKMKTMLAPAFRHAGIWKERNDYPDKKSYTILVTLPFVPEIAEKILHAVLSVKASQKGKCNFWIKIHPSDREESIRNLLGVRWPEEFQFVNGDIVNLIQKSNLLISSNSGTNFEALAMNTPVIVIGNSDGLTFNVIPDSIDKRFWRLCYSIEEVQNAIHYFRTKQKTLDRSFPTFSKKLIRDYFEKINYTNVQALFAVEENNFIISGK